MPSSACCRHPLASIVDPRIPLFPLTQPLLRSEGHRRSPGGTWGREGQRRQEARGRGRLERGPSPLLRRSGCRGGRHEAGRRRPLRAGCRRVEPRCCGATDSSPEDERRRRLILGLCAAMLRPVLQGRLGLGTPLDGAPRTELARLLEPLKRLEVMEGRRAAWRAARCRPKVLWAAVGGRASRLAPEGTGLERPLRVVPWADERRRRVVMCEVVAVEIPPLLPRASA